MSTFLRYRIKKRLLLALCFLPHPLSHRVEQCLVHALIEVNAVGHGHLMRTSLSFEHVGKSPALHAPAATATPHHARTGHHFVVFKSHLQEIIQEVMKRIPLSISLHAQIVSTSHLRYIVPNQAQTQTLSNVLSLAHFFFDQGNPKAHTHNEHAMTHVTHGIEPLNFHGNAKPTELLSGHGNSSDDLSDDQIDLVGLGGGELTPLNHLGTGLGVGVTGGAGYVLTIGVVGKSTSHASDMDTLFATVHQKQSLPVLHLITATEDAAYPILHCVRTSRHFFLRKKKKTNTLFQTFF